MAIKQHALTYDLGFGDGIERAWEAAPVGDQKSLATVLAGLVVVDIAGEDDTDALQSQHKLTGDLATGVPTIELTIGDTKKVLTWQEAYNLAEMLTRQVNLALYG